MYVEPGKSIARYNYVIHNHEKLIALLEGTSNNAHNQGTWGDKVTTNECGTSACAMGWAAISGEFENLKSTLEVTGHNDFVHWKNDEIISIHEAARREFGEETLVHVFLKIFANRCETIRNLKQRIEELKKEQNKLRPFRAVL